MASTTWRHAWGRAARGSSSVRLRIDAGRDVSAAATAAIRSLGPAGTSAVTSASWASRGDTGSPRQPCSHSASRSASSRAAVPNPSTAAEALQKPSRRSSSVIKPAARSRWPTRGADSPSRVSSTPSRPSPPSQRVPAIAAPS
jgi:hypothetical protein